MQIYQQDKKAWICKAFFTKEG